jgi:hypothetical protein
LDEEMRRWKISIVTIACFSHRMTDEEKEAAATQVLEAAVEEDKRQKPGASPSRLRK